MRSTILVLSASLSFPASVFAETLTNAFVMASGDGIRFVDGRDFAVTGAIGAADVSLAPNPGWRLLTPPEISVSPGGAVAYRVRSLLGEDEGGGAVTNEVPEAALHLEPPTISASVDADVPYVYTQPQPEMSNIVFRLDGVCDTPGRHGIEGQEPYDHLTPTHWTWEWGFGAETGIVHGASVEVGPFVRTKGVYGFIATLTASNSACPECTASTNLVRQIVVSELILTGNPWIGQDRTGDPDEQTTYPMFSCSADLDPANPDVDHIEMDYHGVCDTVVNYGTEIHAWCTNRELSSISYTNELFSATAIPKMNGAPSRLRKKSAGRREVLRDANGDAATPAQMNRRGTVQKVDVTIGSWTSKRVEEAGEEAVGSYVLYRNGTPTVADIASLTPVTFICEPNDLPSDSIIRITHSGKGTLYQREAGGSELMPVTTLTTDAASLGGKDFFLHGSTVSSTVADSFIRIEHPDSEAVDEAMYTVLNLSLDMPDLFHSEAIPSEEKQNPGAFIHWNIDNDDMSESLAVPKHYGGDYLQTTESVQNEDDLVPFHVTLHPTPVGGSVTLSCEDGVSLWKARTKGQNNLLVSPAGTRTWELRTPGDISALPSDISPLFAEGVTNLATTVTLSYSFPLAQTTLSDSITITPIAANCGVQPTPNIMDTIKTGNALIDCEWSITRPPDKHYNCMAWVADVTNSCYNGVVKTETGEFAEEGYDESGVHCVSIDLRWGNKDNKLSLDDIDLFMSKELNLVPTDSINDATVVYYDQFHAAKRKNCPCEQGQWILFESKMGEGVRLEHLYNQITLYGNPVRFYAPPRNIEEAMSNERN